MKTFTLAVVTGCVLVLSACGGSDELPSSPNPNATQAASVQQSPRAGGQEDPAPKVKDGTVNAEDYRGGSEQSQDSYFFKNADGSYACTIAKTFTGCDSTELPKDAPEVMGAYGKNEPANAVAFDYGKKAKYQAASNPVYTYIAPDSEEPGGKELPAGATLTAHDTTCEVTDDGGVTCDNNGHGFTVTPNKAEFR